MTEQNRQRLREEDRTLQDLDANLAEERRLITAPQRGRVAELRGEDAHRQTNQREREDLMDLLQNNRDRQTYLTDQAKNVRAQLRLGPHTYYPRYAPRPLQEHAPTALNWIRVAGENHHGRLEFQTHRDEWRPDGYTREMDYSPRPPSPDRHPHLQRVRHPIPEAHRHWQLITPLHEPHQLERFHAPQPGPYGRPSTRGLTLRQREHAADRVPDLSPPEDRRLAEYLHSLQLRGPGPRHQMRYQDQIGESESTEQVEQELLREQRETERREAADRERRVGQVRQREDEAEGGNGGHWDQRLRPRLQGGGSPGSPSGI